MEHLLHHGTGRPGHLEWTTEVQPICRKALVCHPVQHVHRICRHVCVVQQQSHPTPTMYEGMHTRRFVTC